MAVILTGFSVDRMRGWQQFVTNRCHTLGSLDSSAAPHRSGFELSSQTDAGAPLARGNNPMDPKADDPTTAQPTIDYPAPILTEPPRVTTAASASGGGEPSPRMAVVAGSGVHLSEETRSLLRV